jgi:hypothetical protein
MSLLDPELTIMPVISLKEEEEIMMEQEKIRKNEKG